MKGSNLSHTVHLAPNRDDLRFELLVGVFKTFCHEVDRWKLCRRKVDNVASSERFLAIAFPEKLETNPHLHAAADFHFLLNRGLHDAEIELRVHRLWRKVTRGTGTAEVHPLSVAGLEYIAKEVRTADHRYVLSSEFHTSN
jgi:hypothetical protein